MDPRMRVNMLPLLGMPICYCQNAFRRCCGGIRVSSICMHVVQVLLQAVHRVVLQKILGAEVTGGDTPMIKLDREGGMSNSSQSYLLK